MIPTTLTMKAKAMLPFSFFRLCALLALLFAGQAVLAQTLQVNAAWYGTETRNTGVINNAPIVDKLRASVANGVLSVPRNMNYFLGDDPYPGVKKVLAVQVVHNGRVYNIRQEEGKDLIFPGKLGESYLPAPADAPVEVLGAWYGIEGGNVPNAAQALDKVRRGMINGNVYVPGDMNAFFGFDTAPGKVKKLAVTVRYKGQTLNLRQVEGRALLFPGVEGEDYMVRKEVPLSEVQKIFKADFYVLKYPDLEEAFGHNAGPAWDHYQRHGMREGRDPAPNISIAALKMRYPYLAELYGDDNAGYIQHYLASPGQFNADPAATGFADQGMFASPKLAYFDADYYFRKNPEVCSDPDMSIPRGSANCNGSNVLTMNVVHITEHYLKKGAAAGYKPNNIALGSGPQSANGKETMRAGDWLGVGEYLVSRSGGFVAIMQANGDFAVYHRKPGTPLPGNAGYADVHTGVNLPANPDGYFVTMQGDGRLCTYKGTSPTNNKGYVACSAPAQEPGDYYVHLQSDRNLVIRAGTSMFNDRGYVWDFISTRPSKSIWAKILNPIRVVLGCN